MTQLFEPTLIVTRLAVTRGTHVAYDEKFHTGVNVIRGENSSGKSTILNFLFYGLGGDLSDWSDHALLCDYVWLEVEINGNPAVLRREIEKSSRSGMEIFGGSYDDAVAAPLAAWTRYPYQRREKIESFSQALFRLLGMPDVAGEGSGNITMHQMLRLLYADQLSPPEELFRHERMFNPADVREVIGNLLCGAYDSEIYDSRIRLREDERAFDKADAQLGSFIAVIGGGDATTGIEWGVQKKAGLVRERDELMERVAEAEKAYYASEKGDEVSLDAQQTAFERVQRLQADLGRTAEAIRSLEFELVDSDRFIGSLNRKIEALRDASRVAESLGTVVFTTCPACYAEIDPTDETACHLCHKPLDEERVKDRVVGLINEASIQRKQSQLLQDNRREKIITLRRQHEGQKEEWERTARELETLRRLPSSAARDELRALQRRIGYLDSEIDEMDGKLGLAQRVEDLRKRKSELQTEIDVTKERIEHLEREQVDRLASARRRIEMEIVALLRQDLKRQDTFENPQDVEFSFRSNGITVDNVSYFSASSRVILKNSFIIGFLKAALDDPAFRHPRFVLIDVTENMGMEAERSHNFQDLMMSMSDATDVKHQIIYATAFPSPNIPDDLMVGKASTRDERTLAIRTS